VHDVLEEQGELFLVMEYVEGETLRQRLQRPITSEQFFEIATQCAEALMAAHERSIVHCDIKPENIMLTRTGQVKVLDFGLARQLPVVDESAVTASLESSVERWAGTPAYMAPEALLNHETDARADIFSLGSGASEGADVKRSRNYRCASPGLSRVGTLLVSLLVCVQGAYAAETAVTADQVIARMTQSETKFLADIRGYTPLLETYIQ
jgi:serine/threonine protein kinase